MLKIDDIKISPNGIVPFTQITWKSIFEIAQKFSPYYLFAITQFDQNKYNCYDGISFLKSSAPSSNRDPLSGNLIQRIFLIVKKCFYFNNVTPHMVNINASQPFISGLEELPIEFHNHYYPQQLVFDAINFYCANVPNHRDQIRKCQDIIGHDDNLTSERKLCWLYSARRLEEYPNSIIASEIHS